MTMRWLGFLHPHRRTFLPPYLYSSQIISEWKLLSKAKFSIRTEPTVGRQGCWIISSKPRRNFETEKRSRQFHQVQSWSSLCVTYTQAGRIRWMDDPEAFAAALCTMERGTGGFKGVRSKNTIWLPSEKHYQPHWWGLRILPSSPIPQGPHDH